MEYLAQVDFLALVVVAVQHLAKQRVVEADVLSHTLGALTVVRLQEAGAAVCRQLVLLHTPEEDTADLSR